MNQRCFAWIGRRQPPPYSPFCYRRCDSAATQLMSSKHCKVSGLRKNFNPKLNAEGSIPRSMELSRQVAKVRSFRDIGGSLTNDDAVLTTPASSSLQSSLQAAKIADLHSVDEASTVLHFIFFANSVGRSSDQHHRKSERVATNVQLFSRSR